VKNVTEQLQRQEIRLQDTTSLDALIQAIGDARFVLLGEASHGTSEFYTWRTEISKRLIAEKDFSFIAVEGDWPSCYGLNRFVKHYSEEGQQAEDVLRREFGRWPTWMWANEETASLAEWLKQHNADLLDDKKIGFFGLDVYSLWESMEEIIHYLEKIGSKHVETAKKAFACFEPHRREGQSYGISASFLGEENCEDDVVELLTQMQERRKKYDTDKEAALSAELNALVAVNAEKYYRSMVQGGPESWNVRDHHMVEALNRLMDFHGPQAKAIVWEHNTHIGDARATDMAEERMVNVGQLVREQNKVQDVFAVGFGTHRGKVIAAKGWGAPIEEMNVPQAYKNSWEDIVHQAGNYDKMVIFDRDSDTFRQVFGHRAIGVVYHPEYERGNYVPSNMAERYDAFIHIDESSALRPLIPEAVYV
jgi:erythromycin esterase-like protein